MPKAAQWWEYGGGRVRVSTTTTRLWVPFGRPDHVSDGEMSEPSQVYCEGISPPGGIAGLASTRGIVGSALHERRPIDKKNVLRPGETDDERDALSERDAGVSQPDPARLDRPL